MTPFRIFIWSYNQVLPKPHPKDGALARESTEFCICCCPFPPFQTRGSPTTTPQSQPRAASRTAQPQPSPSSSNTQGGRTKLCTRQMVPALCNTLGQGIYFQKGFSFFSLFHFFYLTLHSSV